MRHLLFLFILIACASCDAQKKVVAQEIEETPAPEEVMDAISVVRESNAIAQWTFSKKETGQPNEYLITATLKLANDWHIFDFNPGGDGLLIAPDFTFENKELEVVSKKAVGKLISSNFAGVEEKVRYYENQVRFELVVRSNTEKISGSVYYQLCDHEKCLAPTEEPFRLN